MAAKNRFLMLETIIVIVSGFLLIWGLWPPGIIGAQIAAIVISLFGLALTVLITTGAEGEEDVEDITLINGLLYPLIVGDVLAMGSWFDTIPSTQSVFLDMGLIMGLFIIFIYIWYLLKEKVKGIFG